MYVTSLNVEEDLHDPNDDFIVNFFIILSWCFMQISLLVFSPHQPLGVPCKMQMLS